MLTDKQKYELKENLDALVTPFIENYITDMEVGEIKEIQKLLHSKADSLEDDIQDIEHSLLNLRTYLIAWLLGIFAKNEDPVHSIKANEHPLGFTIEVDIPWDDDTEEDFLDEIERRCDAKLNKAWNMYNLKINQTNSTMTFTPTSS